jgi:hypothetical protein
MMFEYDGSPYARRNWVITEKNVVHDGVCSFRCASRLEAQHLINVLNAVYQEGQLSVIGGIAKMAGCSLPTENVHDA